MGDTESGFESEEARMAYEAAIEAGERAHLLTVGSEHRFALRVTRGSLDARGEWHPNRLDVFPIWNGCRYYWTEIWLRCSERSLVRLARLLPRPLRYFVVINEAAAVSAEEPHKVVPEITWSDMAKRLEQPRG